MRFKNTFFYFLMVSIITLSGCLGNDNSSETDDSQLEQESFQNWFKMISGATKSMAFSIVNSRMDGYFVLGNESTDGPEIAKIVFKLDNEGNVEWKTNVGSDLVFPGFEAISETADGGCIYGGSRDSQEVDDNLIFLVKLDKSGKIEWQKDINNRCHLRDIKSTPDGGYVIATSDWSDHTPMVWSILIKTDSKGDEVWRKNYYDKNMCNITSIFIDSDESILAAGSSHEGICGPSNALVLKTDKNGNELWKKNLDSYYSSSPDDLLKASDGTYVLAYSENAGMSDDITFHAMKMDSGGHIIWDKEYGEKYIKSVCAAPDGGFVYTETNSITKVNSSGTLIWERKFNSPEDYEIMFYDIILDNNDRYVAIGHKSVKAFVMTTVPDNQIVLAD